MTDNRDAAPMAAGVLDDVVGALAHASEWIGSVPHDDNCIVSSHYEGDPGRGCNCGKDSVLDNLFRAEEALATPTPAPEAATAPSDAEVWAAIPRHRQMTTSLENVRDVRAAITAAKKGAAL